MSNYRDINYKFPYSKDNFLGVYAQYIENSIKKEDNISLDEAIDRTCKIITIIMTRERMYLSSDRAHYRQLFD